MAKMNVFQEGTLYVQEMDALRKILTTKIFYFRFSSWLNQQDIIFQSNLLMKSF